MNLDWLLWGMYLGLVIAFAVGVLWWRADLGRRQEARHLHDLPSRKD